ncbi:hypothetical protein ABKN59_001932 [Abortiporus biennis]
MDRWYATFRAHVDTYFWQPPNYLNPRGHTFLATMSDAAGFGTGGTSRVLTAGAAVGNVNCNTTDSNVDFFFELNTALTQCRPYTFGNYVGAVQPVTITAVIPGGQSFILQPPTGPTSYDWTANVAAQTSLLFIMTDARGRQGGSSDVKLVGISDDATCLDAQSPKSVAVFPSATSAPKTSATKATATKSNSASSTGTPSETTAPDTTPTHKTSVGAIVGGVLAGLFGLLAVGVLFLFFWRRRGQRSRRALFYDEQGFPHRGKFTNVDLNQDTSPSGEDLPPPAAVNPYPYSPGPGSTISTIHPYTPSQQNLLQRQGSQFDLGSNYQHSAYQPSLDGQSVYGGVTAYGGITTHSRNDSFGMPPSLTGRSTTESASTSLQDSSMSSAARRKAAMAGETAYKAPTRFILHTDLEEAVPDDEHAEVVELPPQYSERRAPLPDLLPPTASTSATPSTNVPTIPPPPPSPTRSEANLPYR